MAEDRSVQQMQATGAKILQTSPGLPEKLAAASKSQTKVSSTLGRDDRDTQIMELQRQLDSEKDKNRSLEDQYKHRIAVFTKRETQTKNKIESLEKRLMDGSDADEHGQRMAVIENMHKSVVAGLEVIQTNTAKILQDQEKDLMRAFRARLQEVSKDLEAQKRGKGEHNTEFQARHRRVVAELHEAQELAQTFDRKNQHLQAENQKLQEKLRTREDDRQALLRELVLSRKDAARLKAQQKEGPSDEAVASATRASPNESEAEKAKRKSFSQKQIDQTRLQQTRNQQYEREVAYRDAVTKLKRMVEAERKKVQQLKQQQAEMLQHRTELEVLLRQCLDDVKGEILRQSAEQDRKDASSMVPGPQPVGQLSVHELTAQDRERVLELLLSQQRVVQLLYSKTFPQQPPSPLAEEMDGISPQDPSLQLPQVAGASSGHGDDFGWLRDVIPQEA